MIQSDYSTFRKLARRGNLVPVYESFTADLLTPVGAYLRVALGAKYSFLLESVEGGETIARYTFAGANPAEVFRSRGRKCSVESGRGRAELEEDPIRLRRQMRSGMSRCVWRGCLRLLAARLGVLLTTWCG